VFVVGLTGGLGAGKSTLASFLVQQGATVIDADSLAHRFLEPGTSQYRALLETFGENILTETGAVDRARLADRAFASPETVKMLNGIIHPALVAEIRRRIAEAREVKKGVLVVDAALLLEWDLDDLFDVIVNVEVAGDIGLLRAGKRMAQSADRLRGRLQAQLSAEERRRRSSLTIQNNLDKADLEKKARELWNRWTERPSESEA